MTPNCKGSCCCFLEESSGNLLDEKWYAEVFEVDGFEIGEFEDLSVVTTFLRPPKSSRVSSSSGLWL